VTTTICLDLRSPSPVSPCRVHLLPAPQTASAASEADVAGVVDVAAASAIKEEDAIATRVAAAATAETRIRAKHTNLETHADEDAEIIAEAIADAADAAATTRDFPDASPSRRPFARS
jgi:hypothetical protein